jgi:hypothetical protein
MYDSAVIVVPGDGNAANALALHVFGHQGESLSIEPWTGPLPAHVAPLLAEA